MFVHIDMKTESVRLGLHANHKKYTSAIVISFFVSRSYPLWKILITHVMQQSYQPVFCDFTFQKPLILRVA